MTFIIQGPDNYELMPVADLFKEPEVRKIQAINPEPSIKRKDHPVDNNSPAHQQQLHAAVHAYQVMDRRPETETVLFAKQIMTSPIVTLSLQARVSDALGIFQTKPFHHIPVVGEDNRLTGIISDRDIMHHLGGITEDYHLQVPHRADERIEQLMQPQVLAASPNTDVRYIARLFVERHVGAMPIVTEGKLTGIVTRSDILNAVMRHFVLELWA